MSRVPCPIDGCDHPARSGYMCGGCEAELARALQAVPGVVADLHVTLSRQTSRTTSGKSAETPLPYDARASEAGWVLRSALVGWVRQLQELQPEPWPDDTAPDMAAWLSGRLQRLVRHPAAQEAHGEICEAVRAAQRVTDRPAERQFAGRCPQCDEPLYAKPGAGQVQCRDCDADPLDVDAQRDQMLDQIADQLMTATQVADVLTHLAAPLRADLVRQWASRPPRRLTAHGNDQHGHPLYRVSDVRDLLVEKLKRDAENEAKRKAKTEKVAS